MNKQLFPKHLSACFFLLAVSGPGHAADDDFKRLLDFSLDQLSDVTIVTASKNAEQISDTPATVIVITRQQILDRRYINLMDLLQDLPGLDILRNSKSSAYHETVFRGYLGNDHFLILQDGMRIDSPAGAKIPVADNFPLYHVKQVEILYGPAAALYGADAFGGVINIITRDADDDNHIQISTAIGSDDYRYHQMYGSLNEDGIRLSAGGHIHSADTGDLAKYYPDEFMKTDATTFAGDVIVPAAEREDYRGPVSSKSAFAKLLMTDNLEFGLNYSFFRSLTSTGDRPDTALYLDGGQWNTEITTVYSKYRFDLSDKLSGELLLSYLNYRVDPMSRYQNIFVNFSENGYQYARDRQWNITQHFEYQLADKHKLSAGFSYEDFYSIAPIPSVSTPYDTSQGIRGQGYIYENTDLPIQLFDLNYNNTALYLQMQSAWNAHFSTSLGLRYDRNSRYDNVLNPRLGMVYKTDSAGVFKLLYGEAYRAPSVDEGYATFGSFSGARNEQGEYTGSFFRVPNPGLEPERSRSLEGEWHKMLAPTLRLAAGAYYAELDDLIVTQDEIVPTQYIPGAELSNTSKKGNAGKEHHYGVDISLNYRGALTSALKTELWAAYSYVAGAGQKASTGRETELPYVARHKIKLGTTLRYRERYFITPKLYLIGRSATGREDKSNPGKRIKSPGYVLAHLHMGARDLLKHLDINLDIYNLFNTQYYAAAGSAGTTFVAMPQQPRSMVFSLNYRF